MHLVTLFLRRVGPIYDMPCNSHMNPIPQTWGTLIAFMSLPLDYNVISLICIPLITHEIRYFSHAYWALLFLFMNLLAIYLNDSSIDGFIFSFLCRCICHAYILIIDLIFIPNHISQCSVTIYKDFFWHKAHHFTFCHRLQFTFYNAVLS